MCAFEWNRHESALFANKIEFKFKQSFHFCLAWCSDKTGRRFFPSYIFTQFSARENPISITLSIHRNAKWCFVWNMISHHLKVELGVFAVKPPTWARFVWERILLTNSCNLKVFCYPNFYVQSMLLIEFIF
jgi:hypothetical protein